MREQPSRRGRQDWRLVGAGFVLAAFGLICLAFGATLTNNRHDRQITSNRDRIQQLEKELRSHHIPVPPPTTTTVTTQRQRPVAHRATTGPPTSTTTTTTSTTTPPTSTCVLVVCLR